ncbi:hypothetical protein [Peterkaempfera sp. SMS 1(5)a]|uniref:hypothetical protein n=1 Tax=Peterkaempfera podocarpi TaxID=3232308 RepID=UPI003672710A
MDEHPGRPISFVALRAGTPDAPSGGGIAAMSAVAGLRPVEGVAQVRRELGDAVGPGGPRFAAFPMDHGQVVGQRKVGGRAGAQARPPAC